MRYKIKSIILLIGIFIMSIPVISYGDTDVVVGVAIDKKVNIQLNPNIKSQILQTLNIGQNLYIDKTEGKWYRVSTDEGIFGYAHSESVVIKDNSKVIFEEAIVNVASTYVVSKPDINSRMIGKLGFLSKVTVLKKEGNWAYISLGDEPIGWVKHDELITQPFYPEGKVNEDTIGIKKENSTNSEDMETLNKGEIIKIIGYDKDYYKVEKNHIQGWIHFKYINLVHKDYIKTSLIGADMPAERKLTAQEVFSNIIKTSRLLGDKYTATAYDLSIKSCGKAIGAKYRGITRAGLDLNGKQWGDAMVVAVDPRYIPLGSKILVIFDESDWRKKYNGVYLAADTGGGVKGKTIDIYLGDIGNKEMREVRIFGRGYKVKVYMIE